MKQMQPWYWRSLPLEDRTGSAVFATLFDPDSNPDAIATLLESPYPTLPKRCLRRASPTQLARYSICAGAPRIVDKVPQLWTPPIGEILPFLQQQLQVANSSSPLVSPDPPLPFTGGWLGWLGYDLAWEIEQLPYLNKDTLPFPVAYWYEPECFAVLDHWEQILWLAASNSSQLERLQSRLKQGQGDKVTRGQGENSLLTTHYSLLTSQEQYETAVRRAKKYIQAGDIFQANLSLRFEADTAASNWTIYQALQQINPSPFASYWQTPWGAIISCSPERLVSLQNGQAETRPIAGTRRKGATPQEDRQLAQDLLDNAKERAEHIMLVDLERNDLGRVCQWGSVAVNELLTIEHYSHVMHLVSNITGTLRPDYNAVDLIRAMFPGGTITGCPKVRSMEIIEELEPVRRNLFYGSCGYLDRRGNLDLNILIRTLLFSKQGDKGIRGQEGQGKTGTNPSPLSPLHPTPYTQNPTPRNIVWGQVGAGIVADSDPEREWFESLHKAQAQLKALKKVEGGQDEG
jgi:para-aminobenzoate synthetase component 1